MPLMPLVICLHPATRRSGEVNFVTLALGYARTTGEDARIDEIRTSEEVPKHQVYLCKRNGRLFIPHTTKWSKDRKKGLKCAEAIALWNQA